jgi:probable F420-dependent oxidoreductase
MKFTITYPLVAHPSDPALLSRDSVLRFARAAEAAGFDGIGFTDHPAPSQRWLEHGGHDALDPFAALAFCAAVTERIRLIPNIVVLPYRNPFVTAKSIATVDLLSNGRFTLATAIGYLRPEYRALGVDFEARGELFDEAIEVMKGIWTRDDYAFEGPRFMARGNTANPKPVQKPHPPIWIGGNSQRARQRVATQGQGWIPFPAGEVLAKTSRTTRLETTDDLRPMLDDLWERVDAAGRKRSEIDVHFACNAGGVPGRSGFDANAHLEGIAELEALGVGWVGAGVPGDSVDESIAALELYGEEVIAKTRGSG